MAEEAKTDLEKTLRALLLINLDGIKQKPQIAILDKKSSAQRQRQ
jgi:hypothetical protein